MNQENKFPIISSIANLKYFSGELTEDEIINILSDFKHRVFPRPFERQSNLRVRREGEGLVGIEIGVAGGEHALSLLKNLKIKRLYLIDPYELYNKYSEGKIHFGGDQLFLDQLEVSCRNKLKDYERNLVWIKKLSSDAISDITEKVDFVYIDGNHQEEFVVEDIDNYFSVLNSSGVIGGHDYYNGFQREHDGVVNAVTKFVKRSGYQLRVEMPDWWIET